MTNETVAEPGTVNLSTTVYPGTVDTNATGGGTPNLTPDKADAKQPAAKPESTRDTLSQELTRLKAEDAKTEGADKAKPDGDADPKAKAETARGERGQFAPKPKPDTEVAAPAAKSAPDPAADKGQSERPASRYEAPARFNDQGKAEWEKTPEPVQAEVHRTIKNYEDGYAKHKDAAERYEQLRPFDEGARRSGLAGVHESLQKVIDMERVIERDPVEGFKRVASHYGLNLQAIAARIMGENPDQRLQSAHEEIQGLKTQIHQMQHAQRMPDFVAEFAAQPGHEDFHDLASDVSFFLKSGMVGNGDHAQRLENAYELAKRLRANGASSAPSTASPAKTDPASSAGNTASPANPKIVPDEDGTKSIRGAPNGGEDPIEPVADTDIKALLRRELRSARA